MGVGAGVEEGGVGRGPPRGGGVFERGGVEPGEGEGEEGGVGRGPPRVGGVGRGPPRRGERA